jgi:hypothetical protein
MQEYLRDAAHAAPESISFSAEKVISGYCDFRDYEAVLLHKKEVEKPTAEEVWYAYANMQRQTSTNYCTTSEKRSACYVCGCKITHAMSLCEGPCYYRPYEQWTIRQVIPFLNRQEIWNYRLVCELCSGHKDMSLYHAALLDNHDRTESQAVRESITMLFEAVDIYHHNYMGEKREGSSSEEEEEEE